MLGLAEEYSTHCFRRGGAQFCFFERKHPWRLEVIKKWGNWAPGEKIGTLINYILNEYAEIEDDWLEMGNPWRRDRKVSPLRGNGPIETVESILSRNMIMIEQRSILMEQRLDQKFQIIIESLNQGQQQINVPPVPNLPIEQPEISSNHQQIPCSIPFTFKFLVRFHLTFPL